MRYHDKKWKMKRRAMLRRDKYLCRECKRYGKATQATSVHHIIVVDERPDLYLANDNLISLCNSCHNKMHDRFTDELTIKGKVWVKRIIKKINKLNKNK